MEVLVNNQNFVKNGSFAQKSKFCQNGSFGQKSKFCQKWKFWSTMEVLVKNGNFGQKSKKNLFAICFQNLSWGLNYFSVKMSGRRWCILMHILSCETYRRVVILSMELRK